MPVIPSYRFILRDYYSHPSYAKALAESVPRSHWEENGRGDHLVCLFHGIPKRLADEGDIYLNIVKRRPNYLLRELGYPRKTSPWHTNLDLAARVVKALYWRNAWNASKGIKKIDIMAPAFSVDCLETLEEISDQCKETFIDAGGSFSYIMCLNDRLTHRHDGWT